jgi:hypothetical protein
LVSALALSVPSYTRGGAAPTGSLDVLMAEFSGGSCIGRDARRSKHFMFCYLNLPGDIEDVYAHFKSQPAFVGHVCVLRRGPTTAVLVLRSTMVGIVAESLVVGGVAPSFEGRLPSVVRNQARVRSVLINWCGYGEVFYGDFVVINNMACESRPTFDQVQSVLHALTETQRASLFGNAHLTPSRERSGLQAALVALGERRLRPVAVPMNCVWTAEQAARECLLRLDQFTGLADITLSRWCELTDTTIHLPFLTYVRDSAFFRKYSLVLLSPPGMGKSPLARSVCLLWAAALALTDGRPGHTARFLECNTLDILRTMPSDCNEHTPVLFDEVSFCDATQFQHMSINMAKVLLSAEVKATLHGRNNDIALAAGQPRIFTSNSEDLLEFVGMGMTENNAHFKAMRKRCFVGHLTSATVSPSVSRRDHVTTSSPIDTTAGEAAANFILRQA